MSVTVLDREMYTEAAAARLLGLPQGTLNYWLEGGERRGKVYPPVIRVEPRGDRAAVTWAEFVEAGLLREYRRKLNVPMAELRAFIDVIRGRYGTPYPLADRRPYVSGRELLSRAQEAAGLDAEGVADPSSWVRSNHATTRASVRVTATAATIAAQWCGLIFV